MGGGLALLDVGGTVEDTGVLAFYMDAVTPLELGGDADQRAVCDVGGSRPN